MDRKFVIASLAAAGFPVASNISNIKLEAFAIEKGVPLDPPNVTPPPAVVVTTTEVLGGTPGPGIQGGGALPPVKEAPRLVVTPPPANDDDVSWRVTAGLSYEEAVRASRRQKELDAEIAAAASPTE